MTSSPADSSLRRRRASLAILAALLAAATLACAGDDAPGANGGDPSEDGDDPGGGPDAGTGPEPDLPLSTEVMPILEEDGFYPRAIRLGDGTVLASIVAPQASGRLGGTILESRDHGVSFAKVGNIDGDFSLGGLCCATLYELPAPLGDLPAGALLWSASVGGDDPGAPMSIPVFASTDRGRSWSRISTVAVAAVPRSQGGLWEPEFSQLDDGSLVCHYSDETDPAHSQKLVAARTGDGLSWGQHKSTVALAPFGARPGMPVVRRPPGGDFVMSYEICGTDGCATHLRRSPDGWDWGDPGSPGPRPATLDGKHFRHAPTLSWVDTPGANGRFYLVGQELFTAGGQVAPENGTVLLANSEGGHGSWYEVPAPVPVPEAYDNFCPNYSSAILPQPDGRAALEIASKYDGNRCRSYFARGPLLGTGDASGVEDGGRYRLVSLMSGLCLDISASSTAPGANVQQWTCNGADAQRFTIELEEGGGATLRAQVSDLCVAVEGGAGAAGANVVQGPCEDSAAVLRLENIGVGYYRLVFAGSDHCLDVAAGSTAPGGNVQRWHCNHLAPQIWRLERS